MLLRAFSMSFGRSSEGSSASLPVMTRLARTEDALRAADRKKGAARGDTGRLAGFARTLAGTSTAARPAASSRSTSVVEVRSRGYDRFESGIRSRAHAIVSFVAWMVRDGV
jgi:hypothetical protein